MPRVVQRDSDGVPAALAIHLCAYCAAGALFALLLYYLMQPTRLPNPGIAALKSSPTTVSYIESLRVEREATKRAAVNRDALKREVKREPEPETTGVAARHAADEKSDAKKAKTSVQQRTRAARRAHPADTMHYAQQPDAQQPFSGGYQAMY